MFEFKFAMTVLVYFCFLINTVVCSSTTRIYVSKSKASFDDPKCGRNESIPCKSIMTAMQNILKNKTQRNYLLLDAGDPTDPATYTYKVSKSIETSINLTVQAYGKQTKIYDTKPIIKPMESDILVFIKESERETNLLHTIRFVNIHFFGMSILDVTGVNLKVDIWYCNVEKTPKHVIFSKITVENLSISMKDTIFTDCRGLVDLSSPVNVNVQFSGSRISASRVSPAFAGISILNSTNRCIIGITSSTFQNVYKPMVASTANCGNLASKISLSKNTLFQGNAEPIHVTGCFTTNIQDTTFKGNYNGALLCTDTTSVYLTKATFEQNTVRSAVTLIRNGVIIIKQSHFFENSDRYQGGAIFAFDNTVIILNSNFTSNYAPLSGGAIYHDASKEGTELDLKHVTIFSKIGEYTRQGTLLYSSQKIKIEDSTFHLQPGPLSNLSPYNDVITSNLGILVVPQNNFYMSCPESSNVKIVQVRNTTRTGMTAKIGVYSMGCKKCPSQTFSQGISEVKNAQFEHSNVKCIACPGGANCSNGIISQSNFWGYQSGNKEFKFLQCPGGYCCSKETIPCTSYQTCRKNREGFLCGTCKGKSSLDFFSDNCTNNIYCNKLGFWFLNLFYAFIIGCCFLNLEYIILSLDSAFRKKKTLVITEMPSDDEGLVNRSTDDTMDICDLSPTSSQPTAGSKTPFDDGGSDAADFIIGFGKILAFFYQIEILLRVNTSKDHGVFSVIVDFILSFFNYRFDSNRLSSLCPSSNTNHLTKEVAKLMTLILSPVLMLLLYLPIALKQHIQNTGDASDLKLRFRQCLLHLTLFSYTNIANFCIVMINCVDIFGKNHLFIHGDTICYNSWQYAIFAFMFLWLIPFPFAMHFSVKLLRSNRITPHQFYCVMLCPWLVIVFHSISKNSGSDGSVDIGKKMEIDCILQVFIGPFCGEKNGEAQILVRRLVLSIVCCAINDPVTRLFTSFPILAACMLYHIYTRPYKGTFNNGLETACFSFLLWFNVTNLFWAFSYINYWSNEIWINEIVSIFNIVQDVLIAIPALVFLLAILFVLIKKAGHCFRCNHNR